MALACATHECRHQLDVIHAKLLMLHKVAARCSSVLPKDANLCSTWFKSSCVLRPTRRTLIPSGGLQPGLI